MENQNRIAKKISLYTVAIFAFLVMLACSSAYANRPFSTEDAAVADKDSLEMEVGFEYTRQGNSGTNYNILLIPCYGLTENMQISIEVPWSILRPVNNSNEDGLGDITLVIKTLIFSEKEKTPSVLLKTAVKSATGDKDENLGSGDEDVGLILAVTKFIGPITIHSNVGYTFVGSDFDSTFNDYLLYGIALDYSATQTLSVVSELYGESESEFIRNSHTITPLIGLTYQLTDKVTVDVAFKMGICYDKKTDYGVISGASISF